MSTFSMLTQMIDSAAQKGDGANTSDVQHLDDQAQDLNNQFHQIDEKLDYGARVAVHTDEVASYLVKANNVDNSLAGLAVVLRSENEASPETLQRLVLAREEVLELEKDLLFTVSNEPELEGLSSRGQSQLEMILIRRQEHTKSLDKALDPLLIEFQRLLDYQDGLRSLDEELAPFINWTSISSSKVDNLSKKVLSVFSSWLDANMEQPVEEDQRNTAALKELSLQLESLRSELKDQSALIENRKQDYQSVKEKVKQALESATVHSKQLQLSLENATRTIDDKFEALESFVQRTARQDECHDRRATWEQQALSARESLGNLDAAITTFVLERAQWNPDEQSSSRQSTESDLDASLSALENHVRALENQMVPEVQRVWSDLCASLVFVDRDIPHGLQSRQDDVGMEYARLRNRVTFGNDLVNQHKLLSTIAKQMAELERRQAEIADRATTLSDEQDGMLYSDT